MRAMTPTCSAFSVFATLLSIIRLTTAGCYWPDRTDRNLAYDNLYNLSVTTENYKPCPANPGQSYSMCCAYWNECKSNGLCWDPNSELYWRESCSDISWESSACIKLFINDTGASDDITISECLDGSFCYGTQNLDCCDAGEGVYVVDGVQNAHNFNATTSSTPTLPSTSTSLVPTSRTSAVASKTATNTINPTTIPQSSTLSTGAKAGIGVGAALGALFSLGVLIWILMRRHRSNTGPVVPDAPAEELNAAPQIPAQAGLTSETKLEKRPSSFYAPVSHAHEVASAHRVEMPSTLPAMHQDRDWNGVAELGAGP